MEPVRTATAAGDAVCLGCHADKRHFEQTAHARTSRHPTRGAIAGSFLDGENVLRTSNPFLLFRMDSNAAGFFQSAVSGRDPNTTSHTERIAYVIGSGRKGQTYLYQHAGDELFELPVSYWTSLGQWVNSPGYVDGTANFGRRATPRCLECHSTWFEQVADSTRRNRYRSDGAILGITCEKCHGAGQAHVTRERSRARAILPRAIMNPTRLSRPRQLEACAQCHGGVGELREAAFTYVPGRPLKDHLQLSAPLPREEVDVHGNQVALLARSRCFQSSQMTCSTCHDVHRTQRDLVELSGRCLTCHQEQSCRLFPQQGHALKGRCVDCHMPLKTSNAIISGHEGRQERPQVRTHWIKIYSDGSAK
ncbi:MAG: multiheme c-type cytochrome [Gemmatimonadaceae bacterium]